MWSASSPSHPAHNVAFACLDCAAELAAARRLRSRRVAPQVVTASNNSCRPSCLREVTIQRPAEDERLCVQGERCRKLPSTPQTSSDATVSNVGVLACR